MKSGLFWKKKYSGDILAAFMVLCSPFLIYIHLLFSDELDIISIFGFQFKHEYLSNEVFVWAILKSLVPLILLLIWFFSTAHKWRYLIFPLKSVFIYSIADNLFFLSPFEENQRFSYAVVLLLSVCIIILIIDFLVLADYRKNKIESSIDLLFKKNLKSSYKNYSLEVESIVKHKSEVIPFINLSKMYSIKKVLEKYLNRPSDSTTGMKDKNKLILDIVICFVLLMTPLLLFIYYLIPEGVQQIDLRFMVMGSNGFMDVNIFVWFLCYKLIILIPLILWFTTCQHWWKYAILSPIILYTYQFWEAFQDEKYLDALGNLRAFPAVFAVVLLLLLFSRAVKYKTEILDIYEYLNIEIEKLLMQLGTSNTIVRDQESRYKSLKQQLDTRGNSKEHINELIRLREELLSQLDITNG